jgi:pimeloyl-ACP methyl ester carboxylesterase
MLRVLGPLAFDLDGRVVPLRLRPKAVAVLARLAGEDGWLARADLAALIFPDAEDPKGALRWHLSYLRSHLPSEVRAGLETAELQVRWKGDTDLSVFRRGTAKISNGISAEAAATLDLYRGDFCDGVVVSASPAFDSWLDIEQEALRRTFRQAVVAFARVSSAAGTPQLATAALARLASVDPYFEDGHVLLIQAYEAEHRSDSAAAAYQRYQRIVRQELQAEPAPIVARRYESDGPTGRGLPIDDLVELSEITMHTVEWSADGPTLLAIHGSSMSAYALTVLAERLAPNLRVIAMDLRGNGLSDKPPGAYHVRRHSSDVHELIATLGLQRPVVLGFSLGGAVATVVASDSDNVGGLILLEGVVGDLAFTSNAAANGAPRLAPPTNPAGLPMTESYGGFEEYLTQWRAGMPPGSTEAERLLERVVRYELEPQRDGTYRRRGLRQAWSDTWASLMEIDSLALLSRVRCPVLIVQAALDWIGGEPYLSDAVIDAQRRSAPHATHYLARLCNHPMLARDPEPGLIAAIKEFVVRASTDGPPAGHATRRISGSSPPWSTGQPTSVPTDR